MATSSAGKIRLADYDSLFASSDAPKETAEPSQLPIDDLHPFTEHPFKLYSEERMAEMVESVEAHGVLMPILVRPREQGGYEIVSGHNRVEAAKRAGMSHIPATVREMDDETAIILMVDSNLRQREKLLPSEKAFAYQMKLEAIKRQAGRPPKENSRQVVGNFESADIVGENSGESGRQVQRFIRLTNLIPPLLDRVDDNRMAFSPAVAISYLNVKEQCHLLEYMETDLASPSLEQAEALKAASQKRELEFEDIFRIMHQPKPNQNRISLRSDQLEQYLPKNATPKEVESYVMKAVAFYHDHLAKKRQMER